MTLSERRYYRLAVLLSIIFHGAIILINLAMPQGFSTIANDLETLAPGMLDLPGSPNTQPLPEEPGPDAAPAPARVEEPVNVKPETKAATKPEQAPQALPKAAKTELKLDKTKEIVQKDKPKLAPSEASQLKDRPREKIAPPHKVTTKTDHADGPNSKPGKADGSPTGEGVKNPPAAKNFGTGELMVAAGLDSPIYYPKDAQNEGKEGEVTVRVYVAADGRVENAEVIQSSGDVRLDKNALNYGRRKLRFKAVHEEYYVDYLISYKLDQDGPRRKFLRSESRL